MKPKTPQFEFEALPEKSEEKGIKEKYKKSEPSDDFNKAIAEQQAKEKGNLSQAHEDRINNAIESGNLKEVATAFSDIIFEIKNAPELSDKERRGIERFSDLVEKKYEGSEAKKIFETLPELGLGMFMLIPFLRRRSYVFDKKDKKG